MDWQLSISALLSIGGIVASVASSTAVVRTKVVSLEKELGETRKESEELRDKLYKYTSDENVKIAVLEKNQANHDKELSEMKGDIKTIKDSVQEIKEAVIKKGDL